MSDECDQRLPVTIPEGACVFGSGNDGYAEFTREDGSLARVRVTFSRDESTGGVLIFNTDELVTLANPGDEPSERPLPPTG